MRTDKDLIAYISNALPGDDPDVLAALDEVSHRLEMDAEVIEELKSHRRILTKSLYKAVELMLDPERVDGGLPDEWVGHIIRTVEEEERDHDGRRK